MATTKTYTATVLGGFWPANGVGLSFEHSRCEGLRASSCGADAGWESAACV